MTTQTACQPKFTHAGRTQTRDMAIGLVANGNAVTVSVPDEDWVGMGDLNVTVTLGSTSAADPCAYAKIPVTAEATTRLASGDLEVYAAVMTAAASLMDDVNKILATW